MQTVNVYYYNCKDKVSFLLLSDIIKIRRLYKQRER